jgi:long-chain acyl-CoA synthetase
VTTAAPAGVDIKLAIGGHIDGFEDYEQALGAEDGIDIDDPEPGVVMYYTSGTTGHPKGVYRRQRAAPSRTLKTAMASGYTTESVHLCTGPLYHAAPMGVSLVVPLGAGAKVVLMDKWDAEETLRLIERYGCSHTHMVPTQFIRMLQLPDEVKQKYDVSAMKWAIHAAAPCPVDTKRKMLEWWGPVIWEYYAATEGGGTIAPPDEWLKYPGSVGRVWPNSELKITDDDGNVTATGEPGTVWMKMGSGRTFEYKGDDTKTNDSHDADGFFTVGDVGYLNEDGYLFLCDRKSDMIIAGGINIYPAEIEGCIHEHPQVADIAVFGVPDEEMGEQIKAVVQPLPGVAGDDALRASIMEHLQTRLGKYKWPRSIDFMDELPREPTGKLLKRTLRDPYWEGRDRAI